jgi:hypothetical protein
MQGLEELELDGKYLVPVSRLPELYDGQVTPSLPSEKPSKARLTDKTGRSDPMTSMLIDSGRDLPRM